MEIDKPYLVFSNFCFCFLIVLLLLFYRLGYISTPCSCFFVVVLIVCSLGVLFSSNIQIIDATHAIFFNIGLSGITLCSNNPYLLSLNLYILTTLILVRKKYGYCSLYVKQKNSGFFYSISTRLNKNPVAKLFVDWDYMAPILLSITTVRLLLLGRRYKHQH